MPFNSNDQRMKQQESFFAGPFDMYREFKRLLQDASETAKLDSRIYAYSRASMARIENAQGLCVRAAVS
jgi:hypothetical protein